MKFTKMHGCGNDYIYINGFIESCDDWGALSEKLSDRHFSVGSDGVIVILPSDVADFRMRMFNADGSEGKMCGNGSRCVAKYCFDKGLTDKTEFTLETLAGIKTLSLQVENGITKSVSVGMGRAEFSSNKVPVIWDGDEVVNQKLSLSSGDWNVTCVSMGNPHCVVFSDPDEWAAEKIGPLFENAPIFPERTNTEFVKVLGKNEIKMRVWERGSGETWACGTGACAAAVAAVLNGFADRDADITVRLRGGDLTVRWAEDTVYMTGAAALPFTGEAEL